MTFFLPSLQIGWYLAILSLSTYLTLAVFYLLVLSIAYYVVREPEGQDDNGKTNRFAIIVPAHNEELFIGRLCDSFLSVHYPLDCSTLFIVADNCTDCTARIAATRSCVVLVRENQIEQGKGYAIEWALRQISPDVFDAFLIVDSDSTVDPHILTDLNKHLNRGDQAIQCCNAVGNPDESSFTQILSVSRTINNLLYHHSKYKLGLSSYLMGNGICLSSSLLKKKAWTAFSIGEDWEYSARLCEDGIRIAFAKDAKVFHQESTSLHQATSQRLRWSGGRFAVARRWGLPLFVKGLLRKNWTMADAFLPLVFPNYSLQMNLSVLVLLLSLAIPAAAWANTFVVWSLFLIACQIILFALGTHLAGNAKVVLRAVLYAPLFLTWKAIIDFASITGIYRGNKWVRTARRVSPDQPLKTGKAGL